MKAPPTGTARGRAWPTGDRMRSVSLMTLSSSLRLLRCSSVKSTGRVEISSIRALSSFAFCERYHVAKVAVADVVSVPAMMLYQGVSWSRTKRQPDLLSAGVLPDLFVRQSALFDICVKPGHERGFDVIRIGMVLFPVLSQTVLGIALHPIDAGGESVGSAEEEIGGDWTDVGEFNTEHASQAVDFQIVNILVFLVSTYQRDFALLMTWKARLCRVPGDRTPLRMQPL